MHHPLLFNFLYITCSTKEEWTGVQKNILQQAGILGYIKVISSCNINFLIVHFVQLQRLFILS